MNAAPALICASDDTSPQERQLGPPIQSSGAGNQLTSVGTGTCQTSGTPELTWEIDGYIFANSLYTFPSDGSNIPVIWAYGSSATFGYHGGNRRGNGVNVMFTCQGECSAEGDPTMAPSLIPTTSPITPVVSPTKSPSMDLGSGTIYMGSKLVYEPAQLTAIITIKTGFLPNDPTTNGVETELTTNSTFFAFWIGLGFGTQMANSFAVTCNGPNDAIFVARKLGLENPGNVEEGLGTGECEMNGDILW
eukprot:CAMPEP_0114673062 /NCGR_PEP_ID=MMETSP0191-20121206/44066_1 /TAXON_ID=126664 /ORGANISM="Sorites sp." /LENGTH=247 /DNA_ID=CAMNT_0001937097 /DNA_START=271 /DNA_END=1011 /DNA_ORIENTATION=-